jgi:hypothetical protein
LTSKRSGASAVGLSEIIVCCEALSKLFCA